MAGDGDPPDSLQCRGRAPHGDLDAVDQRSQRVSERDARIVLGDQVGVDGRGDGPAGAVAQDDEQFQAPGELGDGIVDAPQALDAQHVARDPDHEEVVRRLVEDLLDGHPGVGAAEHQGERGLDLRRAGFHREPQGQRVRRDDDLMSGVVADELFLDLGDDPDVTIMAPFQCIDRARRIVELAAGDRLVRVITVDDIHDPSLGFRDLGRDPWDYLFTGQHSRSTGRSRVGLDSVVIEYPMPQDLLRVHLPRGDLGSAR